MIKLFHLDNNSNGCRIWHPLLLFVRHVCKSGVLFLNEFFRSFKRCYFEARVYDSRVLFEDCLVECISSLRSLSVIHPLPYFLNASFWDMSSLWSPVIASIADAHGYALSAIFKPLYRKRLTLFKQKHRGKAEGILKIYKVDK